MLIVIQKNRKDRRAYEEFLKMVRTPELIGRNGQFSWINGRVEIDIPGKDPIVVQYHFETTYEKMMGLRPDCYMCESVGCGKRLRETGGVRLANIDEVIAKMLEEITA